jgi:hypothetical protein
MSFGKKIERKLICVFFLSYRIKIYFFTNANVNPFVHSGETAALLQSCCNAMQCNAINIKIIHSDKKKLPNSCKLSKEK